MVDGVYCTYFFFFQAEDGIRDIGVTGVQTCALPILPEGLNGRIVLAASHHHGGAKDQTLSSRTCDRGIFKAPAYHGLPNHPYNTIRPVLHEPAPIANGTYASLKGIPISEGEVLNRRAVHDNSNLHVASMGFWALWVVKDDSVQRCESIPKDV